MTHASEEFDDLYRRCAPAAFRRARRLLANDGDVHQVVHEVFLALVERPQQYQGHIRMSAFLYSAVTHACLNRIRSQRTTTRLVHEALADQSIAPDPSAAPANHGLSRSLLLRMPEPIAEVAVYYYIDELTHEQISRVLGGTRSHVGDLVERLSLWLTDAGAGVMSARTRHAACPSDLILDAWTAAELDAEVATQVEQHLSHCTRCQAQHATFENERAEFLAAAPTFEAQRKRLIAARPRAQVRSVRSVWAGSAAAALVVCAVGLVSLRPWRSAADTRIKSTPHLGFFIQRGEHVTRGFAGASLQGGDLLRFAYSSDRDSYFALLNVDARGASVYYPSTAAAAQRVHAGSDVPLAFSVELDARPGAERVLGVFCRAPFRIAGLLATLQRSGSLPEREDCIVDEVDLSKRLAD